MLIPPTRPSFTRRTARHRIPAIALTLLALATAGCADVGENASIDIAAEFGSTSSTPSSAAPVPDVVPVPEPEPREQMYIYGTLDVHAEPSQDAPVVRTLARGDQVQLGPADANGWARLYTPGSPEGYVYRESDKVRDQAPAPESRTIAPGYHLGPRGGCYTYTKSGNKRYVDRSHCR